MKTSTITLTKLQYDTIKLELFKLGQHYATVAETYPSATARLNAKIKLAKINDVLDHLANNPIE